MFGGKQLLLLQDVKTQGSQTPFTSRATFNFTVRKRKRRRTHTLYIMLFTSISVLMSHPAALPAGLAEQAAWHPMT